MDFSCHWIGGIKELLVCSSLYRFISSRSTLVLQPAETIFTTARFVYSAAAQTLIPIKLSQKIGYSWPCGQQAKNLEYLTPFACHWIRMVSFVHIQNIDALVNKWLGVLKSLPRHYLLLYSFSLGTVHFLWGRGGWWDLRGGACQKIWLQKGGQWKNMVCKGGVTKKIPLSLVVTASVIMQTSVPEGQK